MGALTAQMSDTVIYLDKPFGLVGCQGSKLFDPNQHGLKTRMISTGCWLGYYCTYLVADKQLYLSAVYAGLESGDAEAVQRGEGRVQINHDPRRWGRVSLQEDVHEQ